MVERKPLPAPKRSLNSIEAGSALFPHFRKHISLKGPVTAAQIEAISAATGLKERQIRTLAARYREDPVPESLAPQPKGPKPGTHRIDPEVMAAIEVLEAEICLTHTPPSHAEMVRQISGRLRADNGDYRFSVERVPSDRTIERVLRGISGLEWAKKMGSKSRSAHEPHPGEYLSDGFLDLVQMDHTRGDVILVDSIHREELARPWLTFLIEIWTRCILGYYVSLGDPSIFRCGRAVANALFPKESVLAHLGVEIDYPMYGQFLRLHADQAQPHRSTAFRTACLKNGINPDVREPGPAHLGGHIERLIGTMVGKLRLLPGATGSNATERDGYDAGKEAAMTLPEFERWLLYQIAIYHNSPHAALGGLCPAQVWERDARRHPPLLSVSRDPDHVFREFLPSKTLTVHSNGIHVNYRHYWHDELKTRIGQKLEIGRDERTIQHVFAEIDGEYVELSVKGYFPDVSEAEWEAERVRVRQLGKAYQSGGARAATARAIESAHKEIVTSRAKTKEARKLAKRREREALTLSDLRRAEKPVRPPLPDWKAVSELGDDDWLKVRT